MIKRAELFKDAIDVDKRDAVDEYESRDAFMVGQGVKAAGVASAFEDVDLSTTDHEFANPMKLYFGTGGDVKVDGSTAGIGKTFKNMGSGFQPLEVTKIYKVGTTALDIMGVR